MDATLTLILLIASLAVVVFAGWRGARPTDITRGPRMMPWRFIMLLAAALVFFLLIHLMAELSGRPLPAAPPF
ncbi:hypothetical protein [Brevundimonas sp. LPMIX5]|jgi:uncharacterized membrane protein|uniref:hypothetical protein n=1 Tax=Brevundimonas TaxID=41275 RepID=UPI000E662E3C|nr:hypothetical protein [Brevundimonas sp. LPMIX5]RIJ64944.1 hypothetical protein D1604_13700 [Brevundimonas sp. LPMIX5]